MCRTTRPYADSTGSARAKAASLPPAMIASVLWAASLLAPEIAFGLLMSTLAVLFDPRVDVRACIWLLVD